MPAGAARSQRRDRQREQHAKADTYRHCRNANQHRQRYSRINSMALFSPREFLYVAAPTLFTRSRSKALSGTTKKPPSTYLSANNKGEEGSNASGQYSERSQPQRPIKIPAGIQQRDTGLQRHQFFCRAAPTTMPTATMAFEVSRRGVISIPSATGTHAFQQKTQRYACAPE